MDIERLRDYCLAKKAVEESFPFDQYTLVFKVGGKMFALLSLNNFPLRINLKCDPERAIELREAFDAIIPGYHSNKKHWNTLVIDGSIQPDLLHELIDHSYVLVVSKMSRKTKKEYGL
jgi:predicted DNA-binding protein (MmcQ/YjbR family)